MKRKPCEVCGSEDGPAIYASDDTCCVACQKFMDGVFTVQQWEIATGKNYIETQRNFARSLGTQTD